MNTFNNIDFSFIMNISVSAGPSSTFNTVTAALFSNIDSVFAFFVQSNDVDSIVFQSTILIPEHTAAVDSVIDSAFSQSINSVSDFFQNTVFNPPQTNNSVVDLLQTNNSVVDSMQANTSVVDFTQINNPVLDSIQANNPVPDFTQINNSVFDSIQANNSVSDFIQINNPVSEFIQTNNPVSASTQKMNTSASFNSKVISNFPPPSLPPSISRRGVAKSSREIDFEKTSRGETREEKKSRNETREKKKSQNENREKKKNKN